MANKKLYRVQVIAYVVGESAEDVEEYIVNDAAAIHPSDCQVIVDEANSGNLTRWWSGEIPYWLGGDDWKHDKRTCLDWVKDVAWPKPMKTP